MFRLHRKSQKAKCYQSRTKKYAEYYRPISLTNCFAKIFQSAVNSIVLTNTENNGVTSETHSALRRNRCTTDNLLKVTQHVKEAIQWSEKVGFVCLDIKKPFHALQKFSELKPVNKGVNSFLSRRSIFLKIKNSKISTFSKLPAVPILF